MDPTTMLAEMRELMALAQQGKDVRHAERKLRWKFEELDQWLTNGGFLPKDWQPTN